MDSKHRWAGWTVFCSLLLALACLLPGATAHAEDPVPLPAPLASDVGERAVTGQGKPFAPSPGVYQLWDSQNIDPNVYPIVGGLVTFMWDYLEPTEGQVVLDRIERWVAAQASLGKPAAIGFSVYNGTCCGGNATPQWVYDLDPDSKYVCNGNWVIPKYWNETFLQKHAAWLRAIGERYDGDPRIPWIQIGTGIYGESTPNENDFDACAQAAGLTSAFVESPAAQCTFCDTNPLNGGIDHGESVLIDHIFYRGFSGTTDATRILDEPLTITVDGTPVETAYSDHFGVVVTFTSEPPAQD